MDIFEDMKNAVLDGDEDTAAELAKQALDEGIDIQEAMNKGFLVGIQEAGQLYEDEEYFLPDLICSADAMKCALEVLDDALKGTGKTAAGDASAKVALVTVQGDVHDIGKTIVGAMMTAAGFEVCDLGTDIENETVIEKIRELKPDVLGLSALLTSTMENQRAIIEMLEAEGLRDSVKVIVGGAPVSHSWCDRIGADGYSDDAVSAVRLVQRLTETA